MSSWLSQILTAPARVEEHRAAERQVSTLTTMFDRDAESLLVDFETNASLGYGGNGPVYSVIQTRALALSEIEFAWRMPDGRLEAGPEILRTPWMGGTTGQMVTQMEVFDSLSGTAFVRRVGSRLQVLRPDRVEVVCGARDALDAAQGIVDVLGYIYWPDGRNTGRKVGLRADEVAIYAPMPNPLADSPLGQSWISSVATEIDSDTLMTRHKRKFFTNAATPSVAVIAKQTLETEQRDLLREVFANRYESWENAYKTLFLEGAVDVKVLGSQLEQMAFATTQGAGETRIATASGVPAVIVGFAEGLQAATYSNYQQAMRRFADLTCRPLWRAMVDALHPLVADLAPNGARLWYDTSNVSFLQQDELDAAKIFQTKASTVETLVRTGFTADSSAAAVEAGRLDGLVHTGLTSVQLQPPTTDTDSGDSDE